MKDSFSYSGIFWVNGDNKNKYYGTLTYDPRRGAELELKGFICNKNIDIVYGNFYKNDTDIRIYKCNCFHRINNICRFRVTGHIIIANGFSKKIKSEKYKRMIVSLKDFEDVLGIHCVKKEEIYKTEDKKIKIYDSYAKLSFNSYEKIEYKLDEKVNIKIYPYNICNQYNSKYTFIYEQKTLIVFESKEELSIDDFYKYLKHFRLLVSFFTHFPLAIHEVKFSNSEEEYAHEVIFDDSITKKIINRKYDFHKVEFPLNKISCLKTVIESYFDNRLILEAPMYLCIRGIINQGSYIIDEFLTHCTFIEGFHRSFYKNNDDKKEAKKIKEAIDETLKNKKNDFSDKLIQKVEDSLIHLGEKNLKERLEKLFSKIDKNLPEEILNNKDELINKIKKYRNKFIHRDFKNQNVDTVEYNEIINLTSFINDILKLLILNKIGLTEQIELFKNSNQLFINYQNELLEILDKNA